MASALHDAAADALELLRDLVKPGVPDPDLETLIARLDDALAADAGEFSTAGQAATAAVIALGRGAGFHINEKEPG